MQNFQQTIWDLIENITDLHLDFLLRFENYFSGKKNDFSDNYIEHFEFSFGTTVSMYLEVKMCYFGDNLIYFFTR